MKSKIIIPILILFLGLVTFYSNGQAKKVPALEGYFKYEDGSVKKLILSSSDGHYVFVDGKKKQFLPWANIKKIKVEKKDNPKPGFTGRYNEYTHMIYTLDGRKIRSFGRIDVEGIYVGMEVHAIKWSSVELKNSNKTKPLEKLPWGYEWCCGAKGCDDFLSWGVWRFQTKSGKEITGMIIGGFGPAYLQAKGVRCNSPNNLILKEGFEDDYFTINMAPRFKFKQAIFENMIKTSVNIRFEFINGYSGKSSLSSAGKELFNRRGFLVWTLLGKYQVLSTIRLKDLSSMKMIPNEKYNNIKGSVDYTKMKGITWQIALNNKPVIKKDRIWGVQQQMVPKQPPKGYTWNVYPERVPGKPGGSYVIVPHDCGYLIVPIVTLKRINLNRMEIQLRKDAGGQVFSFSRFHPGYKWISEAPGARYIDDNVNETLPSNAKIWIFYRSEKTDDFIISEKSDIESIEQIGQN